MTDFEEYGLDSGTGLYRFLDKMLVIKNTVSLDKSDNVIRLHNYVTFNWKKDLKQVRVNCKEDVKDIIEKGAKLDSIPNGPGDTTHPYSFLLKNLAELVDVVATLRKNEAFSKQ